MPTAIPEVPLLHFYQHRKTVLLVFIITMRNGHLRDIDFISVKVIAHKETLTNDRSIYYARRPNIERLWYSYKNTTAHYIINFNIHKHLKIRIIYLTPVQQKYLTLIQQRQDKDKGNKKKRIDYNLFQNKIGKLINAIKVKFISRK